MNKILNMKRKKNPEDTTIVYVEVLKLGNKWSVKAVDYAGRSRRSSEHISRIIALRRAQKLADYYHVPCHRYNPYPDGQHVFDWVKTRFNPKQLAKYRYILTDGKTVKLTNNPWEADYGQVIPIDQTIRFWTQEWPLVRGKLMEKYYPVAKRSLGLNNPRKRR